MSDREALIKRMQKSARAIYIATDKIVADDISEILTKAVTELKAVEHSKQGDHVAEVSQITVGMSLNGITGPEQSYQAIKVESALPVGTKLFTHAMPKSDDLNALAARQAEWLKSMGWWKDKTRLESLMLVVSECGEAANEVRGLKPTDKFQTELADIILRTLGLAAENGIDIQQAVLNKMAKNLELKPNPDRLK